MTDSLDFVLSRRDWLKQSALFVAGSLLPAQFAHAADDKSEAFVPVRQITRGPKHHWFGYYDKLEFDPANRYVLSNEVSFEGRTPEAEDTITIGMVDTQDNDRWIPLGECHAWGWQQGCMLQWVPGTESEVIWNDRVDGQFVSHILDVKTGKKRTLPRPVYALSPDGKWAISADFARIQNMRPGYGYKGVADPVGDQKAPHESGIWRVDLTTGESKLIVTLADAAAIPYQGKTLESEWNWFNHLLVNTDGTRFTFLHRWRKDGGGHPVGGFTTRMFTVDPDGSNPYILDPSGYTSHFIWKGPNRICAWTRPAGNPDGFYLFEDRTENMTAVGQGVMTVNGHNTYLPGTDSKWILNDTYPQGPNRQQTVYLYHVPTNKRVDLGKFHSPPQYTGEWRCDTHPRSSNDGTKVVIDSPHGGEGRQLWLLDVGEILKG